MLYHCEVQNTIDLRASLVYSRMLKQITGLYNFIKVNQVEVGKQRQAFHYYVSHFLKFARNITSYFGRVFQIVILVKHKIPSICSYSR